jgi:hypothetical protein
LRECKVYYKNVMDCHIFYIYLCKHTHIHWCMCELFELRIYICFHSQTCETRWASDITSHVSITVEFHKCLISGWIIECSALGILSTWWCGLDGMRTDDWRPGQRSVSQSGWQRPGKGSQHGLCFVPMRTADWIMPSIPTRQTAQSFF